MSRIIEGHQAIIAEIERGMQRVQSTGTNLEIPPRVAHTLQGEFMRYERNRSLEVQFPILPEFTNPAGILQGGILCAMIDNVMGPLSYLVARNPTTTLDLTTNFVRTARPGNRLKIVAEVRGRGINTIHMTAEVTNQKDKLIGTASSNLCIIRTGPTAEPEES